MNCHVQGKKYQVKDIFKKTNNKTSRQSFDIFKALSSNNFFGINSGNCCDMLVTYSEKIQVWERGWWDKCMLMMETDRANSVWHLCSSWITGLGSEALQWETQLQFFSEYLTTLSLDDSWLYCRLCIFFWASHLYSQWSICHKAGFSVLFYEPLEGSGEIGVDSPVWNSNMSVQITVLCLTAIPSKGFLWKGNKTQVGVGQEGSGMCSTESIWIRLTS